MESIEILEDKEYEDKFSIMIFKYIITFKPQYISLY